ncbi:unnamed protein product [Ectocarpus sp. CCAP 1310/34]|nr:unnamed protein product [Ectocarpus sp. CCAP 1310/34]
MPTDEGSNHRRSFSVMGLRMGFRHRTASCDDSWAAAGVASRKSLPPAVEAVEAAPCAERGGLPPSNAQSSASRESRVRTSPHEQEAGQMAVVVGRDGFSSSTGGVAGGARIKEKQHGVCFDCHPQHEERRAATSSTVSPAGLLSDILSSDTDAQDVRRLPSSGDVRLLKPPIAHVITTTAKIDSMFRGNLSSGGTNSNNSSNSHSQAKQEYGLGTVPRTLGGAALSASAVGPRSPGSSNGQYTAPPSTNRSTARAPSTPPSPAALGTISPTTRPYSPRRSISIRTPRALAPLLTDVRRVSWRLKSSRRSSVGGGGRKNRAKDGLSSGFFSPSPSATPRNASSQKQATGSLNPWGGGTPGGKPSRTMSRTRSMINNTFGRMSLRVPVISPRSVVPETETETETETGADATCMPPSPAAAPPSPATASPLGEVSSETPCRERRLLGAVGGGEAAGCCALDMGGGDKEYDNDEDDNESSALRRQPPMGSSMTSSSAFFPPDTASDDDQAQGDCDGDGDWWVEARDRRTEASEKGKQHHLAGVRAAGGAGKGAELPMVTVSARQDTFSEQSRGEVPRLDREEEEEEIVALSSYLACARGRGWPWSGKDILWAEYVSLNGHHRWVRAEHCRHALLLVRGWLYLLELPTEAVTRHQTKGLTTSARGSWYVGLNACDLSHLSVPLAPTEPRGASGARSDLEAPSCGLILHKRGVLGALAWVECRSAASRDALVDHVSAWARAAGTKGTASRSFRVEPRSSAHLSAEFGGERRGRKVASLTDERQACPLW